MAVENFETMLTGGHPNSLGRTVEVVDVILEDKSRAEELFDCYSSPDAVVRLRVSSAFKRLTEADPTITIPFIPRFISEISQLNQASAQWTLAELFGMLENDLTPAQKEEATRILIRNLEHHNDWIVLNMTMETLTNWSLKDEQLKEWLIPHLKRLSQEPRKSISGRANKMLKKLGIEIT